MVLRSRHWTFYGRDGKTDLNRSPIIIGAVDEPVTVLDALEMRVKCNRWLERHGLEVSQSPRRRRSDPS